MNSADAYFHPWIGNQYENGLRGAKVLILGESHYLWNKYGGRDESKNVVQQTIDQGPGNRFWHRVQIGFIGHVATAEERRDFWESVAFYNFIQKPMTSHRTRPTAKQWQFAADPFLGILDRLKPELVAVFGKGVFSRLQDLGIEDNPAFAAETSAHTRRIPHGQDRSCLAVGFKHPSAGFGGYKHHPLVLAAVQTAAEFRDRTPAA